MPIWIASGHFFNNFAAVVLALIVPLLDEG